MQAVLEDWLGRAAPDTWDQWQLKLSLEHMCEINPTLDVQVQVCEWKPWQLLVSKMRCLCWLQTANRQLHNAAALLKTRDCWMGMQTADPTQLMSNCNC